MIHEERQVSPAQLVVDMRREVSRSAHFAYGYRAHSAFRSPETALAVLSFIRWVDFTRDEEVGPAVLQRASFSARIEAIMTAQVIGESEEMVHRIRRAGLQFDPASEVRQAEEKDTSGRWADSLTRALIIITRVLAARSLTQAMTGSRLSGLVIKAHSPFLNSFVMTSTADDWLHLRTRFVEPELDRLQHWEQEPILGTVHKVREYEPGQLSTHVRSIRWRCQGGIVNEAGEVDDCDLDVFVPAFANNVASVCPYCASIVVASSQHSLQDLPPSDFTVAVDESPDVLHVFQNRGVLSGVGATLADFATQMAVGLSVVAAGGRLIWASRGLERNEDAPHVSELRHSVDSLAQMVPSPAAMSDVLIAEHQEASKEGRNMASAAWVQRAAIVNPHNQELMAWLAQVGSR